jgi:hypothetical protein
VNLANVPRSQKPNPQLGDKDEDPEPRNEPCQFDSCDPAGKSWGTAEGDNRLVWVNSYPVTAARYGLKHAESIWGEGQSADLVISALNSFWNNGATLFHSGTAAVAEWAARQGIPGIAVSGLEARFLAWNSPDLPKQYEVYAELIEKLVDTLEASGLPLLPDGAWLNVNIPRSRERCAKADDYSWILTRMSEQEEPYLPPSGGSGEAEDADVDGLEDCDLQKLPKEQEVLESGNCRITVSIGGRFERPKTEEEIFSDDREFGFEEPLPEETVKAVKERLLPLLACSS